MYFTISAMNYFLTSSSANGKLDTSVFTH